MAISTFGVLMVHSATLRKVSGVVSDSLMARILTAGGNLTRDTGVMILAITMGVAIAVLMSLIDYEIIVRLWPLVAAGSLLMMLALFKFGHGTPERPDTITWLKIGGFDFQPSELLKVAFIITFTMHIDLLKNKINEVLSILQLIGHAAVPIALVVRTDDLGSALVFVVIFIGMLFIAGLRFRYFAIAIAFLVTAAPILWSSFFSEFQKQRFLAVYHPNGLTAAMYDTVIYQQNQGINAMGSGGFTGKGLFQGPYTQNGLVPESKNDMIFTVVGEELGFLGAFLLLGVLLFLIVRLAWNGRRTKDAASRMLCYGTAFMIAAQTVINVGMCLKILPVIGITLPFMSAGGSSNLCIYIAVGIALSVYRFNKERAPVDFRLSRINTPFAEY
ncbi:MAG: FtsW/RodA/SpoVE family cell cycle protein [Oscillospiraceae bacterium]|nr:FtsW/RodA/SpoVE family cell cycle protein [Oscillospiraceae bacterium]